MVKERNMQVVVIVVLAVAILVMSVGFAVTSYNSNLQLTNSQATISTSKWEVVFDPSSINVTPSSVSSTTPSVTGSTVSFNALLTEPGDFYEFTVDVKNNGTFDADLDTITLTQQEDRSSGVLANYFKYEVVIDGQTYTPETGSHNVKGTHPLASGEKETVTFRVTYVQPDNSSDLPSSTVNVTLTASLQYLQAESN